MVEEKKIIMSAKIGNVSGYIDQDSIFLRNIEEYIDESYPILSLESEDKIKDGVFLLNLLVKKGALETEEISELHANYIINTGGAKIQDIKTLIQKIRKIVKDKDGTILNTEVKIVEEWWREYFYLY